MKITIIADKAGRIVGTASGAAAKGGKNPPKVGGFAPLGEGHSVHEVEVEERHLTPSAVASLHKSFRLEISEGTPRLVQNM